MTKIKYEYNNSHGKDSNVKKICLNCRKEYYISKYLNNVQKYCSSECYQEYKRLHSKLSKKICPICNKTFNTYHHEQIHCSKECRGIADRNRTNCVCDYCGKPFERKKSDVKNNKKYFCSKECMIDEKRWCLSDIDLLKENYRKIDTKDLQNMLSTFYSLKAIRSMAGRCGIAKSRKWTEEEEKILKDSYPSLPFSDVLKLLPNKTIAAISGKATMCGLNSFFYLNKIYTQDEINFLKENYLTMSNEELGRILNRTPNAVSQKLNFLSLYRPYSIKRDGYKNLSKFMRSRLTMWKKDVCEKNNYTCCLSGLRSNIIVHHCRGFNLLMEETIEALDFPLYDNFEDYSVSQLLSFVDTFIDIQERYCQYVCVNEEIHRLFHKNYGYGDNTMEQWYDFSKKYKTGYYNKIA